LEKGPIIILHPTSTADPVYSADERIIAEESSLIPAIGVAATHLSSLVTLLLPILLAML